MKNEQKVPFHFLNSESELSVVNLGDVIDIASASRVHKNEWTLEGVRFFRSSDVTSNFFGKDNKPAFISFDLYKSLIKKTGIVKKGDILVTGGGTIGIPYLIDNDHPLYFKDADLLWLKSHNVIDGYYLYSYFSSPSLQKYLTSISHVGTISHYTIEQAKATPIKLPTFDEQKEVGLFFKNLDETISLHQQELEALKQTKQAFLQNMFPKNGENEPSIRFNNSTKPWTLKKFEMICDSFEYGLNASAKEFDGTNQYIRITDIDDESRAFLKSHLTSPDYDLSSAESYLLQDGDLLFARTGASVGKTYLYREDDGIVYYAGFLIRGRIKENFDSEFIFQNTLTSSFKEFIKISSQRSGQPGINAKEIADYSILVPEYEEQTKIGDFFRKLDEIIKLKRLELEALKKTKRGFLQKMFI